MPGWYAIECIEMARYNISSYDERYDDHIQHDYDLLLLPLLLLWPDAGACLSESE